MTETKDGTDGSDGDVTAQERHADDQRVSPGSIRCHDGNGSDAAYEEVKPQ
jgi:hypothetical protein